MINLSKTQVVIADIYGHFDALQRLRREFSYDPQEHQQIYLGDYIDRGPNSCDVVSEVMKEVLEEDAIALLGEGLREIGCMSEFSSQFVSENLMAIVRY